MSETNTTETAEGGIDATARSNGGAVAIDPTLDLERFRNPSRDFGILPFWFLNGELDPDEMRYQLRELADKRMHGVILHGRYGLEMPYLSEKYLDRIKLAAEEANALGLKTWIYDEMNWPSGTADKRVLRERPDLAQRYIECVTFDIEGPWFMCLTGEDSRYLDFQRSTPVAAFALGEDGSIIDLTKNLSFEKVVPWEVPPGRWKLCYVVEKRAEYYIDAMDPESTRVFLELGYAPYVGAVRGDGNGNGNGARLVGFYSDEPAMHYFLNAGENAIVPWTKDMFGRFLERNGYDLRSRLADLFFDVRPDSAKVRYDYYSTTTEFYTNAYYRQIHEWCRERGLTFTAHLLYEEWLRKVIRVEGNLFKHYANMDVTAVDHLYPVIGTREAPDQHVAMKVASSAAHHFGSPRLICESFGGIFMDATMRRMKWIADWEYVLGVNLLNPHGFHYTLEGARKRDWPPSQFYQYPWWHSYERFSEYMSRLSSMLSGGRHVAQAAVLWPINAMFATYRPQERTPENALMEHDFNTLTDLLLRFHVDYDYLDEDVLATAEVRDGRIHVGDEEYEVLVLPPISHLKLSTLEQMETFVRSGGRVLGSVMAPTQAFGPEGQVDVSERVQTLLGVDPRQTGPGSAPVDRAEIVRREHPGGGATAFVRAGRLALHGAERGKHGEPPTRQVHDSLREALRWLVEPDIEIENEELFALHRRKDGRDVWFVVNPTTEWQEADVHVPGEVEPVLWDPSTGEERLIAPWRPTSSGTHFRLSLPPAGSAFLVPREASGPRIVEANVEIDRVHDGRVIGHGPVTEVEVAVERDGRVERLMEGGGPLPEPTVLDGEWSFRAEDPNALVLGRWLAKADEGGEDATYADVDADPAGWLEVGPGAWAYQLPAEPERPWPIPVWYRISFDADHVPATTHVVLDGFAGEDVRLYLNGEPVQSKAERAPFDSQMKAVDVTDLVREGRNVVAARMLLASPTGGIVDRVKIIGSFGVRDGRITAPSDRVEPAPWTEQGYPFFSGRGVYSTTFDLAGRAEDVRLFLEVPMTDDVVDVVVNGRHAGTRLWDPYEVEITDFVRPGENRLELRVANTLANMMNGEARPSGLAAAPRIVAHRQFVLDLP